MDTRAILLLIGALLGATLAPLGSSSIAVAIPIIGSALDTDVSRVTQLLVGSYLFICIVGQVPGGKLADRFGALPILFFGLMMFLIGCLLGYLVHDIVALTVSRMSMAMGTALISPSTQALIRLKLAGPRLPMAFGIYGTAMSAAAALGPWVGGLIVAHLHWSWIFAINLPVAILAAAFIFSSIDWKAEKREQGARATSMDWQGVLLLGCAVFALQAGLGISEPIVMSALLFVSAGFFYAFYRNEQSHSNPIIAPEFFGNRNYLRCCMVNGLNNFTMYSLLFQIPMLLIVIGETDPLVSGSILLFMTIAMMTGGPLSGFFAHEFGQKNVMVGAQLLAILAMVSMIVFVPVYGKQAVIPALVVLGFSFGLTMPLVTTYAMSSTAESQAGMAAGGMGTSRYIGGAIGIAVMTFVVGSATELLAHLMMFGVFGAAIGSILMLVRVLPKKPDATGSAG